MPEFLDFFADVVFIGTVSVTWSFIITCWLGVLTQPEVIEGINIITPLVTEFGFNVPITVNHHYDVPNFYRIPDIITSGVQYNFNLRSLMLNPAVFVTSFGFCKVKISILNKNLTMDLRDQLFKEDFLKYLNLIEDYWRTNINWGNIKGIMVKDIIKNIICLSSEDPLFIKIENDLIKNYFVYFSPYLVRSSINFDSDLNIIKDIEFIDSFQTVLGGLQIKFQGVAGIDFQKWNTLPLLHGTPV